MRQRQHDPVITEVREVRHRIAARLDHDPIRLVAFYMEMQKEYQGRLSETAEFRTQRPASRLTQRSSRRR